MHGEATAMVRALVPRSPTNLGGPFIEVPSKDFDVLVVLGRIALVRFLALPDTIAWFTTADVMHCAFERDGISIKVIRHASPQDQRVYRHAPRLPGLRVLVGRDGHFNHEFDFALEPPRDASCVNTIVGGLAVGDSLCLQGPPGPSDQYVEARRKPDGFEIRTSYHGSAGRWTKATLDETVNHLMPAAALADGSHPQRTGRYDVPVERPDGN